MGFEFPRGGIHFSAAGLLDHHRQRRHQVGNGDRQIEKLVPRQFRMGAAQAVPKHFGQWREPFTGKIFGADCGKLRHVIGNGEDLPQAERRDVKVLAGEPHRARGR